MEQPVWSQDGLGYWRALKELWGEPGDLVLVEHDIIIRSDVLPAFEACSEPWCVFGYPHHGSQTLLTTSLGCVRWREAMKDLFPTLMDEVGKMELGGRPGHWSRLDDAIAEALAPLKPHLHAPPLRHVSVPR